MVKATDSNIDVVLTYKIVVVASWTSVGFARTGSNPVVVDLFALWYILQVERSVVEIAEFTAVVRSRADTV